MSNSTKSSTAHTQNPITELFDITIPELSDNTYAADLNDALSSIKNNFAILSNREFVKGESGDSVRISEEHTCQGMTLTAIGTLIKDCIELEYNASELDNVVINNHTITAFDNLYDADNVICVIKDNENNIKGSLYYVFIDKRFANNVIGTVDPSIYTGKTDVSCVLVYNSSTNSFDILKNAFPTIYYENGVGLCWKIYGNESQIPVQGLSGRDGQDTTLYIVKANYIDELSTSVKGVVTHYFKDGVGYSEIADDDKEMLNGKTALVLMTGVENTSSETLNNAFYFGVIKLEDTQLTVYGAPNTNINKDVSYESIINFMKDINILGDANDANSNAKGLFLPIKTSVATGDDQPVHLLSSTSNFMEKGGNDLNNDVIFTPVRDIDSLEITDNSTLMVEKYLYLNVDTSTISFKNENNVELNADVVNGLAAHNNILKYKLESLVNTTGSSYLRPFTDSDFDTYIIGSRYLGKNFIVSYDNDFITYKNNEITLTDNNVVYDVSTDKVEFELSNYHLDSMPLSFREKIVNSTGLFRWVLCDDINSEYDPKELYDSLGEDKTTYDFRKEFNTIFTTELSPVRTSDFLWFNSFKTMQKDDTTDTFIIEGWITNVLNFNKFVPVFVNDFNIENDTALELNYNVNITGDVNNPKKTLTVHGGINCDELSVYNLTTSGEIKNIYTKDDIVGDKGIKLSKSSDDYLFTVDDFGNVKSSSIEANNINSFQCNTTNLQIYDESNELTVNPVDDTLKINVNSKHIDIDANSDINYNMSHLTVDNSNVIINKNFSSSSSNVDTNNITSIIDNYNLQNSEIIKSQYSKNDDSARYKSNNKKNGGSTPGSSYSGDWSSSGKIEASDDGVNSYFYKCDISDIFGENTCLYGFDVANWKYTDNGTDINIKYIDSNKDHERYIWRKNNIYMFIGMWGERWNHVWPYIQKSNTALQLFYKLEIYSGTKGDEFSTKLVEHGGYDFKYHLKSWSIDESSWDSGYAADGSKVSGVDPAWRYRMYYICYPETIKIKKENIKKIIEDAGVKDHYKEHGNNHIYTLRITLMHTAIINFNASNNTVGQIHVVLPMASENQSRPSSAYVSELNQMTPSKDITVTNSINSVKNNNNQLYPTISYYIQNTQESGTPKLQCINSGILVNDNSNIVGLGICKDETSENATYPTIAFKRTTTGSDNNKCKTINLIALESLVNSSMAQYGLTD